MAFSYQNYTGNNATTTFSIPFTYTDTSEISVTVDGVAETGLTFPSSSEVTLTSAPASGTLVQVRRTTSLTERAVDFASGSVLTEEDLDNSSIQTFHASQEANDRANDAIAFDADGKWDAQNKVIKNLATPTDANDATNKSYVDTSANNAASSAAAALVSQNASAASATASANSATASAGSATTSANEATDSANSATASAASAATATTQAALATSNGAAQVALATSQADNAAASATTAATQATLATTNGAAQVALATTQANNAASSASTAATQATASASSASTSTTQATNSANSATASANSASSASNAQTAAESARDATLAAYDNFDDRYLGAKSSSPTVDNDGNALIAGSLFFDTTNEAMKIYTGSAWVAAYVTGADFIPTSGGGITGDLAFGDNNKAIFGAGNDLLIYHDASESIIEDVGTGDLKVRGSDEVKIQVRNAANTAWLNAVVAADAGAVTLSHNNSAKLATTASGINVTGGLNTTANVGIGTASPNVELEISGASEMLRLQSTDTNKAWVAGYGSGTSARWLLGSNASNDSVTLQASNSTGELLFKTGGANERMRISSSGNVGIGTTAPSTILDVEGANINFASSENGILNVFSDDATAVNKGGSISLGGNSESGSLGFALIKGAKESTDAGYLAFGTRSAAANSTERLRISSTGNVGIGTVSASQKLTVEGTANNQNSEIKITASGVASGYLGSNSNGLNIGTDSHGIVFKTGVTGGGSVGATGSERMRIDSAGKVGIGTVSPPQKFVVSNAGADNIVMSENSSASIQMFMQATSGTGSVGTLTNHDVQFLANNSEKARITSFGDVGIGRSDPQNIVGNSGGGLVIKSGASRAGTTSLFAVQDSSGNNSFLQLHNGQTTFSTGSAGSKVQRMSIDVSGRVLTFKTASGLANNGVEHNFTNAGGYLGVTSEAIPVYINRAPSDGTLVEFRQNNTAEGTISVSGTTVSYNGGHLSRWSQLTSNTRDDAIVKGTVMTNLDQMAEWTDEGVTEENEQLNCMAVSSVEGDANVAGVFVNWDNDDDIYTNDMNVAMTGDMIIRIAQGTTVARGDLLMSAGDGTAKPQGDDIVRSKTIAKVTSTNVSHTYDDGSYCVPCVLMAC